MDQRSDEIRVSIEETREDMGETIEALAYKADVPGRTKDWLGDKKEAVTSRITGVGSTIGDATPYTGEVKHRMGRMKRTAERNPLGVAIGGAAVGFLAGLLTPSTRIEDERLGPMADEIKASAAEAGREALDRGKEVVQDAGQTAVETAKERGREESEALSSSLQDRAREAAETPTSSTPRTGTP